MIKTLLFRNIKMIKFSRTGWNNVIIFSVMGFILLINATQRNVDSMPDMSVEEQFMLVPEFGVILSLTVNQQTHIERIGQTWRAIPAVIGGQPLNAMMKAWHSVSGELIDRPENIDKSQAIIVSLLLAGQSDSEYFMLVIHEQQLIIFKQSTEQWLRLPKEILFQLAPNGVTI